MMLIKIMLTVGVLFFFGIGFHHAAKESEKMYFNNFYNNDKSLARETCILWLIGSIFYIIAIVFILYGFYCVYTFGI